MFNKIQPQQINLHAISSPSGNLSIEQTDSEVKINLYSGLTGSFSVEGGLFLNGGKVGSYHSSNGVSGTSTAVSHGENNTVGGTDSLVGGASNSVLGTRNAVLNGNNNLITASISDGTVVAGYGGIIGEDGAVLLADATVAAKNTKGENSLTMEFEGGAFVQNDLMVSNHFRVGGSGEFSGDINALTKMYYTGHEVATKSVASGIVKTASGTISGTISVLSGWAENASGSLYNDIVATGEELNRRIHYDVDDLVRQTGNQIVSGIKEFYDGVKIGLDSLIQGTGTIANSIIIEDDVIALSTGKNLTLSSASSCIVLLDLDGDGPPPQDQNFGTIWDNSFLVASGNNDPDVAIPLFGVHPSGIGWFKDSIILDAPANVPASSAAPGNKGQMSWERVNSEISYLYINNGTEWHRFSGGAGF